MKRTIAGVVLILVGFLLTNLLQNGAPALWFSIIGLAFVFAGGLENGQVR